MAALRKMLGKADSPYIITLMHLIETQSKDTLISWGTDYCERIILPIWVKNFPEDTRAQNALIAARRWQAGEIKLPEAKPAILACHEAARETSLYPAAQAAARAIGQAASTIHSATHSLGLAFYGAAAIAYDRIGTDKTADEYEKIAAEVCGDMANELRKISVPNEKNPAKINWNC